VSKAEKLGKIPTHDDNSKELVLKPSTLQDSEQPDANIMDLVAAPYEDDKLRELLLKPSPLLSVTRQSADCLVSASVVSYGDNAPKKPTLKLSNLKANSETIGLAVMPFEGCRSKELRIKASTIQSDEMMDFLAVSHKDDKSRELTPKSAIFTAAMSLKP
jgi:hypothetical protein